MATISESVCMGCKKAPHQLPEYIEMAKSEGYGSPAEFVWENEGTLNRENGHFLCTECYIVAGMPSGAAGWVCP